MSKLNMKNHSIFWIAIVSVFVQAWRQNPNAASASCGTTTTTTEVPKTCRSGFPKSCSEIHQESGTNSSQFQNCLIYPHGNSTSLEVLCDFETDGGGWTIIQKRSNGPQDGFNRNWVEYANGFGSLDFNFWLGLENIRALTKDGDQELRIELEDFEGNKKWAKYSNFSVCDALDFYRLSISGFSGDVKDDMNYSTQVLNGLQFTTKDKDNDKDPGNCAAQFPGGWWANSCFAVNLNGLYRKKGETFPYAQGIIWISWKGPHYSLAKTEMKIRKRK